jgi:muramoyltetrapeptide carboxypeptidase
MEPADVLWASSLCHSLLQHTNWQLYQSAKLPKPNFKPKFEYFHCMKRKDFLSTIIPAALSIPALAAGMREEDLFGKRHIPPYLQPGDSIGITSPAGYITLEDIQPAMNKMIEWGFKVVVGTTIGKRDFSFGGTAEERLADLQQMLDDKNIKAIMCARGGYGSINIIDKINFRNFKKHPKWIIGFSDITVLHSHINRHFGIATIHSKMCNSFPKDWSLATEVQKESIESIRQGLTGEPMKYSAQYNIKNKTGIVEGVLVGGNLKTLETLAGSASDISTKNKILFVEDTGEYLYSIDRMFWNLKRTGKLSGLKGLIIGGFKIKKDDEGEEFGRTLEEIVLEKISEYNYPVCFDFPVGHQVNNFALKCGVPHKLSVQNNAAELTGT